MTARKSTKEIFPVPSLSTSLIIFLISSFFGSNPRALMATWHSVRTTWSEAYVDNSLDTHPSVWPLLPWALSHRCIRIHLCRTAQRPPWSPASAPRSAQVWGLSSCEGVAQDPAGMVSWHWLPGWGHRKRKKNTKTSESERFLGVIFRLETKHMFYYNNE